MNILIVFSLVLLTFVRIIGLSVSFDLFLSTKHPRFRLYIIGWFLWVISGTLPFLSEITENQLLSESLLIFNTILILIGILLIICAIISYFQPISNIKIIGSSLFIILFLLLLFVLFGLNFAVNSSFFVYLVLSIFIITRSLRKWRNLRNLLGESLKWFYSSVGFGLLYVMVVILITLRGYSFGLYFVDDLPVIIIYYFFGIGITILIAVLTIHLEHSLSYTHKFQLKDRYSHDLGNIMQIILNTVETSEEPINIQLIKKKCLEAGNLINEIREL